MSQDVERVYTVNLGKVLLSPDNQRAKRAVNMIKEFARHHMKMEQVKLEEDVSHLLWSKGIKHPPRKIRVRMTKTDEGYVLVSKYEGEEESIEKEEEKDEQQKVEPAQVEPEKKEQALEVEPEPAAKPEPEPAAKPEPEPAAKPEPKPEPAAKPDDVPEFFKKKDEEMKKKPKSKSKD
uniref:Large ribosomal subunit protein eL31 n=1 Tax=uncultured marine thaumarchaeote KM3_86_G05 TaxID=1456324 RepID=A0A075HSZ9_9ARCH|nr:ribosomal protein L31e (RP-L31e, RPL31) [uncultured marine thaumarchaeote KM3_86_G05]